VVAGAPNAGGAFAAAAPKAAVVGAPKGDAVLVSVPKEGSVCCEVVIGVVENPKLPAPPPKGAVDAVPKAPPKALDAVVVVVGALPNPPPKTEEDCTVVVGVAPKGVGAAP
jgi:hypothetical protein